MADVSLVTPMEAGTSCPSSYETYRGIGAEACGLYCVFPPDDLSYGPDIHF